LQKRNVIISESRKNNLIIKKNRVKIKMCLKENEEY